MKVAKFYLLKESNCVVESIFEFVKFRDFIDSSNGLTFLQVIGIDKDGHVKTHSAFDVRFFEIDLVLLEEFTQYRRK